MWPFIAAKNYLFKIIVGLAGYLMYRGSRFVVGAFWFVAFGLAIRYRGWIKSNVPPAYGVYTELILLVGLFFYCWWLLLPKIRTWRYQRITARAAQTTLEADRTAEEMRNVGKLVARFYTDVNRFQRHPSERPIDPEDFPEGSYEQTYAEYTRQAQETLERDLSRGKTKRTRKRKPTVEERMANMEQMMAKIAEKLGE